MDLSALQTHDGSLCWVQLNDVPSITSNLGIELQETANLPLINEIMAGLISTYSPHASGILVDRNIGLNQLKVKAKDCGVLLQIQSDEPQDPLSLPKFWEDWGVEQISNNFAAAWLDLAYNPSEQLATEKKQLVAEVYDFCQYQKIPLAVHITVTKLVNQEPNSEADTLLEIVSELRAQCDALVLPTLPDALTAATITAELDIPWVVAPDTTNYDQAKDSIRMAVDSGAQGFVIGEALWSDMYQQRGPDAGHDMITMAKFLHGTSRDRILELRRIVSESKGAG